MTKEKVVSAEEVEKLKRFVDDVLKKSISVSSEQMSLVLEKSDLDKKEKVILNYIKNNPGIIKQGVVNDFENEVGYSKKPVLKIIKKLEEYKMITVTPDKVNSQTHHLFVNNENILIYLIEHIDSFKQAYFTIIDGVQKLEGMISNMDLPDKSDLLRSIILPFKAFTLLMQYNLIGQLGTPSDKSTLDKKYSIFQSTMQEIHLKLYESKILKMLPNDEILILIHLFANNSNGLRPEDIIEMQKTFEQYRLREDIEKVLDALWYLSYSILPSIHSHYRRFDAKQLKDWRKVISKFNHVPYNPMRGFGMMSTR